MSFSVSDEIKVGDRVSVYWENVNHILDAEVLAVAQQGGDVWVLKERDIYKKDPATEEDILYRIGDVHYVMHYARITKHTPVEVPNTKPKRH